MCERGCGMRLRTSVLLAGLAAMLGTASAHIAGDDPGPWPRIFSSVGLGVSGPANVFVIRASQGEVNKWVERVEKGAVLVLEGESDVAEAFGIRPGARHIPVRSVVDRRAPKLGIVWEKGLDLPFYEIPTGAQVLVLERWEGAPLLAAVRRGSGAVLWMAVSPGERGYERFPYLPQALSDLGIQPPVRSARLWAFFDWSYRVRVDLDYFAARWQNAGISALHVAGWHFYEPNPERDQYLNKLIEACHRRAILVYVWLELPHVSEQFWTVHPEWREKTALLQDAQLDWRKLMNLRNRAAFDAARTGVAALVNRFDWDGVNLAELYFESLEGHANPARFTPMNDDIRREFGAQKGFDPIELFRAPADAARLQQFLEYRAELARRQQSEWMGEIENIRRVKPNLDLVLTHVDDRFDTRMRDLIGADASRVLPMLKQHDFTFLIEDPATIWNLGPERYPQIASKYKPLTDQFRKLAIDINIVDRYQDVYPTKQQTGTELYELVHLAAQSFQRVALYFENSILTQDLPLLSAAAASVDKFEKSGSRVIVDSKTGVGVDWHGPALVNGRPWPIRSDETLWLPPGPQVVEPAPAVSDFRVLYFNGDLRSARARPRGLELAYQSDSRALAVLNARPASLEIDGQKVDPQMTGDVLALPRGQHLVVVEPAR